MCKNSVLTLIFKTFNYMTLFSKILLLCKAYKAYIISYHITILYNIMACPNYWIQLF